MADSKAGGGLAHNFKVGFLWIFCPSTQSPACILSRWSNLQITTKDNTCAMPRQSSKCPMVDFLILFDSSASYYFSHWDWSTASYLSLSTLEMALKRELRREDKHSVDIRKDRKWRIFNSSGFWSSSYTKWKHNLQATTIDSSASGSASGSTTSVFTPSL